MASAGSLDPAKRAAELAVAKAALSAALVRPDPVACTRGDIEHFTSLLNATVVRCSPENVQKCKQWALQHLLPSSPRIQAFGKYLCALCRSFTTRVGDDGSTEAGTGGSLAAKQTSAKRRRLHTLYILNDVFYHTKHRLHDATMQSILEPHLRTLVASTASFPSCPKHVRKVRDLLDLWNQEQYYPATHIAELQQTIDDAIANASQEPAQATPPEKAKTAGQGKDAPYIMPAVHGDPSVSWYDLPAGNWLPVLEPNSTRPVNPDMIKPLQLSAGPADRNLVDAVKALLDDVGRIYGDLDSDAEPHNHTDVDEMGERIEVDEITREIVRGDTYYGWSRQFCDKMRRRLKKPGGGGPDGNRERSSGTRSRSRSISRGSSRSESRSLSRPGFGRRRRSESRSISRSRSRNGQSRGSRSPHHADDRARKRRRGSSASSYSRRHERRIGSPARSSSPDYSPPVAVNNGGTRSSHNPPRDFHGQPGSRPPNAPFPPFPLQPGFSGNFVPPPPLHPPPNYQGAWPPPPPLIPPASGPGSNVFPFPVQQPPAWQGGWPVPPPPPPRAPHTGAGAQQGQAYPSGFPAWNSWNNSQGQAGGRRG